MNNEASSKSKPIGECACAADCGIRDMTDALRP